MHSKQQLLLLLLLLAILMVMAAEAAPQQPFRNCTTNCGSLQIPYPFGTTEGCYLDTSFLITCNQTNPRAPATPFLRRSNIINVLSISLDGELRISLGIAKDCYRASGKLIDRNSNGLNLTHFYFSSTRNIFTAIGCDSLGLFSGWASQERNYTTGCVSLCNRLDDIVGANGSCSGIGCCETPIPKGLYTVGFSSSSAENNHTSVHDFNPCGYAFLVEQGAYSFSSTDLENLTQTTFPVVLDWAVGNLTCEEAQRNLSSYACVAKNSYCYNSTNAPGYRCNCSHGFQGNPYLLHGCVDINQCLESNDCISEAKCQNFRGGYNCSCPEGQEGDGKIHGTGCQPNSNSNSRTISILVIALSVSVSVLALLLGSFYAYWGMKKRKVLKLRQNFFLQNGGILLQQRIANQRSSSSIETAKVFTVEELKKATNNFDEGRILGQGGYGTVYKGVLPSNKIVAIKKSKIGDLGQIEQFINEVVVLSQINHRNVVKLLGCCLETEVPLLVYEFIPNGTISEHLYNQGPSSRLSWITRFRIATETASALAYLHSATSTPIIHRDVKTTNILLDSDLTAKVSDFGASRLVPLDQTQLTTLVQGTLGYLDPEYFHTSQLTDKSDVYSFGVVLAELLTGMKALSFNRPESDRNLSVFFVTSVEKGQLLSIIDKHIIHEANIEQLIEVANIAKHCLSVLGEDRPTMKEVEMKLEALRIMGKNRWENVNVSSDETEYLLSEDLYPYDVSIEHKTTMGLKATQMQLTLVLLIGLAAADQALPGCPNTCGSVSVPYPFGIGSANGNNCFFEEALELTCKNSNLFRGNGNVQILSIALDGKMDMFLDISQACKIESHSGQVDGNTITLRTPAFAISSEDNKFVSVGCDTYGYLNSFRNGSRYSIGCLTRCDSEESMQSIQRDGNCTGIGCCQVDIPPGMKNISIQAFSFNNFNSSYLFNNCSYSFVVKNGNYTFSLDHLNKLPFQQAPFVVHWTVGNDTCQISKGKPDYACKNNSDCEDSPTGYGYRCQCKQGFDGNPYHPDGCRDIEECKMGTHNCISEQNCRETEGSFECFCPEGQFGNGTRVGGGCHQRQPHDVFPKVTIGVGVGVTALFIGTSWLYLIYQKRKLIKLKEKFFQQNGGMILKQQLSAREHPSQFSAREHSSQSTTIFTAKQLKKATNNFDENLIIGKGGYGTVFKGFLSDNKIVAIKKSKIVDHSQVEQFVNEVVVLSQINHRNVVKLLGCCLETEVPLL
ncbi:Wall-associated receptor kinase 2, partial [Mucuna pruriens]